MIRQLLKSPIWQEQLAHEFEQPYFKQLSAFIESEYQQALVYPAKNQIFYAFEQCCLEQVQVLILGQDPYHAPQQAHGLCFSVPEGVKIPPSLKNIFREIQEDVGKPLPKSGNLERWAQQGVLLLNSILTVKAGQAASHRNRGWEVFTDAVIRLISRQKRQVVFLLWGNYAQSKQGLIDQRSHRVLTAAHPSPLSVKGFWGNRHFSQTNAYLEQVGKSPIDW